ncbi:unnamed protein product [Pylaiella littoralis]
MAVQVMVKPIMKAVVRIVQCIVAGTLALAISTVTNAIMLAVILARFTIMSILRTTSSVVEFAGETLLNTMAFVRDTVFAILTFMVQTVTNTLLFVLNQLVSVWRVVVVIVTTVVGESCFLTKTLFRRVLDAFKDLILCLEAFSKGFKGLPAVLKAQQTDLKSGVGVKSMIKQSVSAFKQSVMYIVMGDEGNLSDGLVPNVAVEMFKVLPLSYDLGKVILTGTIGVAKEALVSSGSILRELASLKNIKLGCSGNVS